jgi:hypothetical protein
MSKRFRQGFCQERNPAVAAFGSMGNREKNFSSVPAFQWERREETPHSNCEIGKGESRFHLKPGRNPILVRSYWSHRKISHLCDRHWRHCVTMTDIRHFGSSNASYWHMINLPALTTSCHKFLILNYLSGFWPKPKSVAFIKLYLGSYLKTKRSIRS